MPNAPFPLPKEMVLLIGLAKSRTAVHRGRIKLPRCLSATGSHITKVELTS